MTKFDRLEQETLEKAYEANPFWMKAILSAAYIMIERRKKYSGTADPYYNFVDMQRRNPNRTMLDVFLWYIDIKRSRLSATQTDFKDESLVDTLVDMLNYAALALGWFDNKRKPEDVIPAEAFKDKNALYPAICLDMNGTLDTYHGWTGDYADYEPLPDTEWALQKLKEKGYYIIVLTAQPDERIPAVEAWFEEHGLRHYIEYVTNKKPVAMEYIDDRGNRFSGNWKQTIESLGKPTWWEEKYKVENADTPVYTTNKS